MMRLGRRRKLSAPLKVFWSAVFSVLIMAAASIAYLEIYYKADDLVMGEAARDPESTVSVTKIKEGYYFDGPGESTAIIFFSGAKVQEIAYAPLMQRLAERGKDCFLVKVPFRIAFLGTGSADSIMSRYNYPEWYLAGHSMGGVAASSLAANRAEMVSGVILLACRKQGVKVYEYTPLQVKQAVCGYGRAEKRQVMDMVKRLCQLPAPPKPDDAADAVALALCHARSTTSLLFKGDQETCSTI